MIYNTNDQGIIILNEQYLFVKQFTTYIFNHLNEMKESGIIRQSNNYIYFAGDKPGYSSYKKLLNNFMKEYKEDFNNLFKIHVEIDNKYMWNRLNNKLYQRTSPKEYEYTYKSFLNKYDVILFTELKQLVKTIKKVLLYKLTNKPINLI